MTLKIIPQLGDLIYAVYHPIKGQWINFDESRLLLIDIFRRLLPETYQYDLFSLQVHATKGETDVSSINAWRAISDGAQNAFTAAMTTKYLSELLQDLVIFCESVQKMSMYYHQVLLLKTKLIHCLKNYKMNLTNGQKNGILNSMQMKSSYNRQ
jgi:hypothetical protein